VDQVKFPVRCGSGPSGAPGFTLVSLGVLIVLSPAVARFTASRGVAPGKLRARQRKESWRQSRTEASPRPPTIDGAGSILELEYVCSRPIHIDMVAARCRCASPEAS
jgi:hypothetical protein